MHVCLELGRGDVADRAMICLADDDDQRLTSTLSEPVHKDYNFKERKSLRAEHKRLLSKLTRKRKSDKTNEKWSSTELNRSFGDKMRSLWLPSPTNLKNSFARPVIGFVTMGDYGLGKGRSIAKGFILAHCLTMLKDDAVLVRNPGASQYVWAKVAVA